MPTIHVIYDLHDRVTMGKQDRLPRGIQFAMINVPEHLGPDEVIEISKKLLDLLMKRLKVCPETPAHVDESGRVEQPGSSLGS